MKKWITEIIKHWDPYKLMTEVPYNEYDLEIEILIDVLPQIQTPEELAVWIQEIFAETLFLSLEWKDCIQAADKIWSRAHCQH